MMEMSDIQSGPSTFPTGDTQCDDQPQQQFSQCMLHNCTYTFIGSPFAVDSSPNTQGSKFLAAIWKGDYPKCLHVNF